MRKWLNVELNNVESETFRDALKAAGFKWCNNKKAWSWHAGERYYKKSKRKLSMDELRNLYGSEEVTPHRNDRIA